MRRKQIYIAEREELVIRGLDMLFKTLPEEVSIFGYGRDSEEVLQDFTFHTPDILFIDEMLMFHQTMPLYVFLSIKYPQTSTVLMSSEALLPEKRNTHTDYYISKAILDENQIKALWTQLSNQPHRQKNAAESFDICRIKDYIVEHLKEDLSLETIANKLGYNYSYLSTCFSKYVKKGFKQYVNELRIQHACRLLTESETTVSEAGSESGYSSQSYFTQVFKKYTGCTPSAYQLRHGGSDCQMESATLSDVSCIPPETYSHICEKCG